MLVARAGRFAATVARHAVPLGGVFGLEWHPVTAIGVYWLESVLLAVATTGLCALVLRRTSPSVVQDARLTGDAERVRVLEAERSGTVAAGIHPREVLEFHVAGLLMFGVFLAVLIVILIGTGRVEQPMDWGELRDGALAMLVVVVVGVMLDLWRFDRFTVAAARARVDACMVRWGLFWMLGFFGTSLMVFTGRTALFFGFFAVLKVTLESWATLAWTFSWRASSDRARRP